jgi:hypothetical protein
MSGTIAVKYDVVPLSKLIVDKHYQRPLDEKRVKKIVEEFDPRLLGTLEVSVRNGKSAVFDGQHRLAALRALKATEAPCLQHTGLSAQEEAALFVAHQKGRRNIRPYERFHAMWYSGDATARGIKRVLDKSGYKVGNHFGPEFEQSGGIGGVITLERIFKRQGPAGLAAALDLLSLWRGEPKSTDAMLLEGCATLIEQYGDRIDDIARKRLSGVSARTIIRRATGGDMPGGGSSAGRKYVTAELRKIAGVRGRPNARKKAATA